MFPNKLRVSSFPDRFPYYAWTAALSAHSDFVGPKVYACLGVTCHLHFWQNDRGLFCATAVTWGWYGHRMSQHTKLTLEKKILPPLLPGFELATFRLGVRPETLCVVAGTKVCCVLLQVSRWWTYPKRCVLLQVPRCAVYCCRCQCDGPI